MSSAVFLSNEPRSCVPVLGPAAAVWHSSSPERIVSSVSSSVHYWIKNIPQNSCDIFLFFIKHPGTIGQPSVLLDAPRAWTSVPLTIRSSNCTENVFKTSQDKTIFPLSEHARWIEGPVGVYNSFEGFAEAEVRLLNQPLVLLKDFHLESSSFPLFLYGKLNTGMCESLLKKHVTSQNSSSPVRGSWRLGPSCPPAYGGHRWRFLSSGGGLTCWRADFENPPGSGPNHLNRSLHWCYSSLWREVERERERRAKGVGYCSN